MLRSTIVFVLLVFCELLNACVLNAQTPSQSLESLVTPRMRVIIDNDLGGDPDGLFQLAHHLLSPSVQVEGIIASHLYPRGFGAPGTSAYAKTKALEVLAVLGLEDAIPVLVDGEGNLSDIETPVISAASNAIVKEALRTDTELPLYVVCGGGLTNIASAYLQDPSISKKLTVVWIGGPEYDGLAIPPPGASGVEYNLGIDTIAAQVVFNESDLELWQVPRNAYRQPIMSHAELLIHVKGKGSLGDYLYAEMEVAFNMLAGAQIGETYIMGDNPLVLLTALQSSFEPDPSSSTYTIESAPLISEDGQYEVNPKGRNIRLYQTLDNRLLFQDFYAKLALCAQQEIEVNGRN